MSRAGPRKLNVQRQHGVFNARFSGQWPWLRPGSSNHQGRDAAVCRMAASIGRVARSRRFPSPGRLPC